MNLQEFRFDTSIVRTTTQNGQVWFVLADVCKALGIANARDAATRLDEDEKGVGLTDTLGGQQEVTIINESGLYAVILTSRKPEARPFRKWVTSEVLPSIRQTGSYTVQGGSTLHALESRVADLEATVSRLTGKPRKYRKALPTEAATITLLWREHIGSQEIRISEAVAILMPYLPARLKGKTLHGTAGRVGRLLEGNKAFSKRRLGASIYGHGGAFYTLLDVA